MKNVQNCEFQRKGVHTVANLNFGPKEMQTHLVGQPAGVTLRLVLIE